MGKTNHKKYDNKFPGFPLDSSKNYWKYPRQLDGYWHQLSGSEQKCLDYILRHTWGFQKTDDEISLSQLIEGIDGFDTGTGLAKPTVISAIKGLVKKGFIKKSKGKKANRYQLVKIFNYPSKKYLPNGSKENLHTIDNVTIDDKQKNILKYKTLNAFKRNEIKEKPYYLGDRIVWSSRNKKWCVFTKEKEWKEWAGEDKQIEWK